MMQGCPAAFLQPRLAFLLISFQPFVAGLPADFITPAQFRQILFPALPFLDETLLLVQSLPLFPGQALSPLPFVSEASPQSKSVKDVLGPRSSGIIDV
jgi:hypothetical protein